MSGLNSVRGVTAVAEITSRMSLDVSESAAPSGGLYNTPYIRAYARTIGMEYDVLLTALERLRLVDTPE